MMSDKRDITSRADIELVIKEFYDQLLVDEVVGYLFSEVVNLDLEKHLPKLADFWEDQLLGSNKYSGNPMKVHMDLHLKESLTKEHFARWLSFFNQTIDSRFAGAKAHLAKEKAISIATVMQIKIVS